MGRDRCCASPFSQAVFLRGESELPAQQQAHPVGRMERKTRTPNPLEGVVLKEIKNELQQLTIWNFPVGKHRTNPHVATEIRSKFNVILSTLFVE